MENEMLKSTDCFHGSDLEQAKTLYGIRKQDMISFSANVNPLGLSQRFREELSKRLDVITSYPDREYTKLREAIAGYCGAACGSIAVGNGSTELISLVIQTRRPQKALILGPAYSEYEREVRLAGGVCAYFPLDETADFVLDERKLIEALDRDTDLLVLCNPNNPTSSVISSGQIRVIVDACRDLDIFVMVDETYVEFAEDYDDITAIPLTADCDNLVVLRGVSKFFAAPGLRLGYAVTNNTALLNDLSGKQNPWAVSSIAETAGQLLFSDTDHIRRTRELIGGERERIRRELFRMEGVRAYPPHANFVLVHFVREGLTADALFDRAIRRGMMIRNCSTFPFLDNTWFRFCFMNPADNDRLLDCLREYLSGTGQNK